MLKIVLADDERVARERLRRTLGTCDDIQILADCRDGEDALRAVTMHQPDLLLLDVAMPGLSGFDVVRRIDPASMPYVVFVTAYDTYALEAFHARALDYVLKPYTAERLLAAVDRARAMTVHCNARQLIEHSRIPAASTALMSRDGRLLLRAHGRHIALRDDELDFIDAANNYVCVHAAGATYRVRAQLGALAGQLDAGRFVRVHRCIIVNVDRVRELETGHRGEAVVILRDGTRLPVSARYHSQLLLRLRRLA